MASFLTRGFTVAAVLVLAAVLLTLNTKTSIKSEFEDLISIATELKNVVSKQESVIAAQHATVASLMEKTESLEKDLMTSKDDTDSSTTNNEVSRRLQGLPDLSCISQQSNPDNLIFAGCNVHIRNGAGSTITTNRRGNLVLGYNEGNMRRTGSHNIVVGIYNTYTSYSGIVAGHENKVTAPFATATGYRNAASGWHSIVAGGASNRASGLSATILGGKGDF
eukprot:CAMPEP_0195519852 /NCGR_PEP_ID=MMETSP0794_2-20130614/15627_1 /TAXON_ID=515487 /ORGANISM="Stephanopyxis turris, Strain CCMP 815" /LENGTH=221 /DNA_ID=CAMNT_0040649083 /DNA_START=45 /DNA_END=710 /DNA_ORIENTATION=+